MCLKKMYNICLLLWQVYELYSQDYRKCPLYGTSHTAVHSQESLILLCRTKVPELSHCFTHQALTPPHLGSTPREAAVTRKVKLSKRRDKNPCKLYCRVRY